MSRHDEITTLLVAMREGDDEALNALLSLLYAELYEMAHRQLNRQRFNRTLNTTALVHEAYLKFAEAPGAVVKDRQHFFALAAKVMRQIIIDYARRRRTQKRGGDAHHSLLDELDWRAVQVEAEAETLLAIDAALTKLAELDERLAQVVELRFFGGLSVEETAETLGVSTPTVKRDTRAARAFLHRTMQDN